MTQNNQSGDGFNSFVLGFILGGVAGILYAPQRGEETRKALKEFLATWSQHAEGLSEEVRKVVEEVKEEVQPIITEKKEKIIPIVEKIKPIDGSTKLREPAPKLESATRRAEPAPLDNNPPPPPPPNPSKPDPRVEKTKGDLDKVIEQARAEVRERVQKQHPKFFKGV